MITWEYWQHKKDDPQSEIVSLCLIFLIIFFLFAGTAYTSANARQVPRDVGQNYRAQYPFHLQAAFNADTLLLKVRSFIACCTAYENFIYRNFFFFL